MPAGNAWIALLTLAVFLDLGVTATAPLGFNFEKRVARNTPERLSRRLRKRADPISVDISNEDIFYLINITIGGQPIGVQLDTGSADLWVPDANSDICVQDPEDCQAVGAYDQSKSDSYSTVLKDGFTISYQDQSAVSGDYINETVAMGNTKIQNMTLGLAKTGSRALGIMGIGYDADESLAAQNNQDPDSVYPNVVHQLKDQGFIDTLSYSLWLNDLDSNTGSILFGGVDTAKYKGDLITLPVQKGSNGTYMDFTVALSSVSVTNAQNANQYQANNLALPVILDSGTTDTYLPDDIANAITAGVGATNDPDFGPVVPCSLGTTNANFAFGFGGNGGPSINVGISEFITPIELTDGSAPQYTDGSAKCGFGLMSSGDPSQPILLGDTFLRSAYVVYDLSNNLIAMGQTVFNTTDTHVVDISGTSIPGATVTASGVAATQTYTGIPHETAAQTKSAGKQNGGHPTGTFNLGQGSGKKSVGVALSAPGLGASTVISACVVVLAMGFGSSLVMLR